MHKKSLVSTFVFLVCSLMTTFLSGCGSDDNADFNIYFVSLGTNTNQNFYTNQSLQRTVSEDLSNLNQRWQTTIMNKKEAIHEFDKFCLDLETKLKTQINKGQLSLTGETYFTLELSHSVKHGQDYPLIASYKIELME